MTKHEAICALSLMATELVGELAGTDSDESNAKLLKRYIDSVNMAISALRQQEHFREVTKKVEPLTNAQKIRAMSDEELVNVVPCPLGFSMFRCPIERQCGPCKREWLKQPAEEDKHEVD